MVRKAKTPRVFFGWWIALTSGFLIFIGQGFGNFGFSALFTPISSDLNFTRAATSIAGSIGKLEAGVLSPVIGWITDRFGPKWVVFYGVSIVGVSLLLMNYVNSLWAFYVVWGVMLGAWVNVGLTIPLDKTITNWFVKKRGRALGAKFVLHVMAAVVMLPLIGWLISLQGWRMTCVIGGISMLVVGLPLTWLFIKQRRPEYYGLLPDGAVVEQPEETTQMIDRGVKYAAEVEEIEFTLRQAMRTVAFWLLMLSFAGWQLVASVIVMHGVPFLTDMDIDLVRATLMIGLMSAGVIPGAFIGMLTADRFKKGHLRFLISAAFFLQAVGITFFLFNPGLAMVYPMFITHHFAAGLAGGLQSILIARYFGRKAFGSIRGTLMMFLLPFAVVAPIYAGWMYDTVGDYITIFTICLVAVIISTIAASLAFPPKPPAHVSDISKII